MKRFLALLLVAALVLSLMLVFTSCNDDAGASADVDENIPGTDGIPSIDVVADPNDPDAKGDADSSYIKN